MMDLVRDVLSWILIVGGGVFIVIGAIGVIRMPDFFTRMHAASVLDTFGASLILVGLMVQGGLSLITVKLAFLVFFLLLTGPTATHALARAAIHAGIKPLRSGRSDPEVDALIAADRAADNRSSGGSEPSRP